MDKHPGLLLLCASPRPRGTSAMLLRRLQEAAGGEMISLYQKEGAERALARMAEADRIVISGPCYINSYPAPVAELLEKAADSGISWAGKQLYGIINGGMPYAHTHRAGLRTLELFAESCGLHWMGGFVLGGGAMLDGQPLEKHFSAGRAVPAFEAFCAHAAAGTASPDALYLKANRPLSPLAARLFSLMLNGMVSRRIRRFGHDPRAGSPCRG